MLCIHGFQCFNDSVLISMATSWSEAPSDILWKIIERLPVLDYMRFGAVCSSWRAALVEKRQNPAAQCPWIVLRPSHSHNSVRFICLSDYKEFRLNLPEVPSHHNYIRPSGHGWLHSLNSYSFESTIHMFHPISRIHFQLPSLPKIDISRNQIEFNKKIKVVVLPVRPTSSASPFLVAAISTYGSRRLAVARAGDESWTILAPLPIDDTFFLFMKPTPIGVEGVSIDDTIADVIFYKEHLYMVTQSGRLVGYDLSDFPHERVTLKVECPPSLSTKNNLKYLVEWCGELLLVFRHIEARNGRYMITTDIRVFKMDCEATAERMWVELKSLRDHALFLSYGYCNSLRVSTQDIREIKENCIYFMDVRYGSSKIKVHDMVSRSFKPLPDQWPVDEARISSLWFTPTVSLS